MKTLQDPRYYVDQQALDQLSDSDIYLQNDLSHFPFRVYNPQLGSFFEEEPVTLWDLDQFRHVPVRGADYIPSYQAGYAEGQAYFQRYFEANAALLYGSNGQAYIDNLRVVPAVD